MTYRELDTQVQIDIAVEAANARSRLQIEQLEERHAMLCRMVANLHQGRMEICSNLNEYGLLLNPDNSINRKVQS